MATQRTNAYAVIYLLQGIVTEKHLLSNSHIEKEILRHVHTLAGLMQLGNHSNTIKIYEDKEWKQ